MGFSQSLAEKSVSLKSSDQKAFGIKANQWEYCEEIKSHL
jgi:hypothetical protein